MFRGAMSLLVGCVAGGAIVLVVESFGHRLYPPPPGADFTTAEGRAAAMAQAPARALWFVILAYALGALIGGALAVRIARSPSVMPAIVVGGVLMLGGLSNLVALPHPWWMTIATIVVFLPAAWAGGKLAVS
jgi:hypothetical protein